MTRAPQDAQMGMDVRRIIAALRISKRFIVVMALCGFVAAFIYTKYATPTFRSSALLQLGSQSNAPLSGVSNISSVLSSLGIDAGHQSNTAETTLLIQSRHIMGRVIRALNLDVVVTPHYFPIIGRYFYNKYNIQHYYDNKLAPAKLGLSHFSWGGERIEVDYFKRRYDYRNRSFMLQVEHAKRYSIYDTNGKKLLSGMVGHLAHTPGKKPLLSIKINKLIARPGQHFAITQLSMEQAMARFAPHLDIDEDDLSTGVIQLHYESKSPVAAVRILNALIRMTHTMDLKRKSTEAKQTLAFLNKQLPHLRNTMHRAENALVAFQSRTGNFAMEFKERMMLSNIMNMQKNVDHLNLQKAESLQEYTPLHPAIQIINNKIHLMKKQLHTLQHNLRALPRSDQDSFSLARDMKLQEEMYMFMLKQRQSLEISKAGVLSDVHILEPASNPPLELPVQKFRIKMLGLLLGLFLAVSYVVLRTVLNEGIADPEDLEMKLGLVSYASIPFSPEQKAIIARMKNGEPSDKPLVLARSHSQCISIESLRSLRTSLTLLLCEAANNIVSINGLTPGIGKSFVSLNLAHVLADDGRRVLLIDADLRKGHLHQALATSLGPGLADAMTEKIALTQVVRSSGTGIDFISRGQSHSGTSTLLNGDDFQGALNELSKLYDVVIIDTAPILVLSDSMLIAKQAGINLLVMAAGRHSVKDMRRALNLFAQGQATITGAVFNFQSQRESDMYYQKGTHDQYRAYTSQEVV